LRPDKSRAQREKYVCACAVHRTQRAESFPAICRRQIAVLRSKNEALETILHDVSNVPSIYRGIDQEKKEFLLTSHTLCSKHHQQV
jgi:hypothetical protein